MSVCIYRCKQCGRVFKNGSVQILARAARTGVQANQLPMIHACSKSSGFYTWGYAEMVGYTSDKPARGVIGPVENEAAERRSGDPSLGDFFEDLGDEIEPWEEMVSVSDYFDDDDVETLKSCFDSAGLTRDQKTRFVHILAEYNYRHKLKEGR